MDRHGGTEYQERSAPASQTNQPSRHRQSTKRRRRRQESPCSKLEGLGKDLWDKELGGGDASAFIAEERDAN